MPEDKRVRTCLWFDGNGETAAERYVALIPGSEIESTTRPDPKGPALLIQFHLAGVPYTALNGGPTHKLSPATSIAVTTADQEETDRLWFGLLDGGGEEGRCGWLVDRFGLSWQVVPEALPRLLESGPEAAARVQAAMMEMGKLDIAALEAAAEGK